MLRASGPAVGLPGKAEWPQQRLRVSSLARRLSGGRNRARKSAGLGRREQEVSGATQKTDPGIH